MLPFSGRGGGFGIPPFSGRGGGFGIPPFSGRGGGFGMSLCVCSKLFALLPTANPKILLVSLLSMLLSDTITLITEFNVCLFTALASLIISSLVKLSIISPLFFSSIFISFTIFGVKI